MTLHCVSVNTAVNNPCNKTELKARGQTCAYEKAPNLLIFFEYTTFPSYSPYTYFSTNLPRPQLNQCKLILAHLV